MASKLNVLVLLFAILIAQQTFAQKSNEEDLKNALENLENVVKVIINESKDDLEKQVLDLVNFGDNLIETNEEIVYGSVSISFQQIDHQIELANKYHVDVSSCIHDEKQQMEQTAAEAADKARTCMTNELHDGLNTAHLAMTETLKFKEIVDAFKKKVENCHDDDCSKTITNDINSTMDSLLLKSENILNDTARSLLNVKKNVENCMKTFISPAVFKIAGMGSDVTQCIAELLANNGH